MGIQEKIKTIIWYVKHPKYYAQFIELVKFKFFRNKKENTRDESEGWCAERYVSTNEALNFIVGKDCLPVDEIYPEIFSRAKEIVKSLPVQMGGGGDVSLLYHIAEHLQAINVIETGVAHGYSSLSLLLSLTKRKGSKLISTDMPYAKMDNEPYVGCVIPEGLKSSWKLIRLPDKQGLPLALEKLPSLDLCHYDSDKSYVGRMWAYPKLWKALRPGGIFLSDDIGDNIAFKEFVEDVGVEPVIIKIHKKYIGILVKN